MKTIMTLFVFFLGLTCSPLFASECNVHVKDLKFCKLFGQIQSTDDHGRIGKRANIGFDQEPAEHRATPFVEKRQMVDHSNKDNAAPEFLVVP